MYVYIQDEATSGIYIETNNGKYPAAASPPDNSPLSVSVAKAVSRLLKVKGNTLCAGKLLLLSTEVKTECHLLFR